jgi:TonB family protein
LLIGILVAAARGQERPREIYLQGRVGDFVTNSFIDGAVVVVEEIDQRQTSDAKGYFRFEGLSPGSYTIRITHPSHRPLVHRNFQFTRGGVYSFFLLRSGKGTDQPYVADGKPQGQFVIDEDAEVIQRQEPKYPESALNEKAEGTILLWVNVDAQGEVASAWFKEGSKRKDLLEASMEAIQYFKFKPAKVKGKPVGVAVTVPFNFRLADKSAQFPIKQSTGALSNEDIMDALNYLGVRMYRFNYELPYKHELVVRMMQRSDGGLIGEARMDLVKMEPGKNALVLYRHEKEGGVEFTISLSGVASKKSIHWPRISIAEFPARGVARVPEAQLQSGLRVPIYVEALSKGGFNFGIDEPIEKIVARAPRSIAVYVELKLEN